MKITPTTIPLKDLILSPLNVRTNMHAATNNDTLCASIANVGLLQPLIVHAVKKPKGKFGVAGGGRRLRAIEQLVAAGDAGVLDLAAIPCQLVEGTDQEVIEASLAENIERVNLNDYEVYRGFAAIQKADPTYGADQLARDFGRSLTDARKIMRLAGLHHNILEALSLGNISSTEAQAYAATTDHDLQLAVFKSMKDKTSWERQAHDIRRAIMGDHDAAANLEIVGREAYLAAGGGLEEDLFTDQLRVLNPDIASRLVIEKVEALKAEIRAAYPGVVIIDDKPARHWDLRIDTSIQYAPEDDQTRQELMAELEELDEGDDASLPRVREINEALDALEDKGTLAFEVPPHSAEVYVGYRDIDIIWYRADETAQSGPSEDETRLEVSPAPATPDVAQGLTQRAESVLKGMRQAAITRGFFDAKEGQTALEGHRENRYALIFMMARSIFGHLNDHGMVISAAGNVCQNADYPREPLPLWITASHWVAEPDHVDAFKYFCCLNDDQVDEIASWVLGRKVEAALHKPNERSLPGYLSTSRANPMMAKRLYTFDAAFWDLFGKQQIVDMFEDCLGDKMSETFRGKLKKAKLAALREYAHKTMGADPKLGLDATTMKLLGLTGLSQQLVDYVPRWLRFHPLAHYDSLASAASAVDDTINEGGDDEQAQGQPDAA